MILEKTRTVLISQKIALLTLMRLFKIIAVLFLEITLNFSITYYMNIKWIRGSSSSCVTVNVHFFLRTCICYAPAFVQKTVLCISRDVYRFHCSH